LDVPNRQDQSTPVVKLTKAMTQSVGGDLSLLDFPKFRSNSSVRGHSIRDPSHPNGSQSSLVMRSDKRWKTCSRTASQNTHQTGIGNRRIALQNPLYAFPGRCRLGQ
jgi:hypothetical protein